MSWIVLLCLFLATVLPVGFGQPEREIEDISCFYEIKSFLYPFLSLILLDLLLKIFLDLLLKKKLLDLLKQIKQIV